MFLLGLEGGNMTIVIPTWVLWVVGVPIVGVLGFFYLVWDYVLLDI